MLNKYDNDVIGSLEIRPSIPDVLIRQASEFLFEKMKWPNQPRKSSEHKVLEYDPAKLSGY